MWRNIAIGFFVLGGFGAISEIFDRDKSKYYDTSKIQKFDTNFKQVMIECSKNREGQNGTWIHKDIIDTFCELHDLGHTHSFEAYYDNELVGGGYGLEVGDIFCGESMFAKKADASKVAFYHLVQRLKKNGFKLVDCQIPTPHLVTLGAKEISRELFLQYVSKALENPRDF